MNTKQQVKISKRLSLVLRHNPQSIGITLDPSEWAEVTPLINALNTHGTNITRNTLTKIVDENPKKRFEFDESNTKIRARQGHSVKVELGYTPNTPPNKLYHGTPLKFLDSIMKQGLQKQQRLHVHMSENIPLMLEVARRRGEPRLIEINAKKMFADGHQFYLTENDVWLCESIPNQYLKEVNLEQLKI